MRDRRFVATLGGNCQVLITNSATVRLPMEHPQPGRYVLTIKTFVPEAVVVKKNVDFSLNRLTVEAVKFHLEPVRRWGGGLTEEFTLEGLEIALRKDGNLPVEITDASVSVGDATCQYCRIESDRIMLGQQHSIKLGVSVSATEKTRDGERRRGTAAALPSLVAVFAPGDRYLVKGALFVGNLNKAVVFEKELVVSHDLLNQVPKEGPGQEMTTRPPR